MTHLLLEPLDANQAAIVRLIGRPIVTDQPLDQYGWPTWDFVKLEFERNNPGLNAEEVLASMPTLQRFGTIDGPYGLYWRTGFQHAGLARGERLGLTIPGLHHLSTHLAPTLQHLPAPVEAILRIIGDGATAEGDLDSNEWWSVTRRELDLRSMMGSRPDPPVEIIGSVLQHEYLPMAVATTQYNYCLPLGEGRFRPFHNVTDAADYLSRLDVQAPQETSALPSSPLALPAVLDYLSRVLSDHPGWGRNHRLVRLPDFESASLVTQPPGSQAEFEQRLSALWTIIGRFDVPEAEQSRYDAHGFGTHGSVNSLTIWLADHAGEFGTSDHCTAAIKIIRNVGTLRQAAQHSSSGTQSKAQRARQDLGLPGVLLDYASAWGIVLDKVASAFYAICMGLIAGEDTAR